MQNHTKDNAADGFLLLRADELFLAVLQGRGACLAGEGTDEIGF